MNKAPLVYTGAAVVRSANIAMIGAMIPKTRLEVAVSAFPVPRSCSHVSIFSHRSGSWWLTFVGKISGVYAYNTAYMTFDVTLKPQFHPSSALLFVAVVEPYRITPVNTVATASVPLRPKFLISTQAPPISAPGTPSVAMIRELR